MANYLACQSITESVTPKLSSKMFRGAKLGLFAQACSPPLGPHHVGESVAIRHCNACPFIGPS